MSDEPRSEIRGARLAIGWVLTVMFAYWKLTGDVWTPFAREAAVLVSPGIADGAYGGTAGDLIDILSAVAYLVGTVALWSVTWLWDTTSAIIAALRARMTRGRQWAEKTAAKVDRPTPDPATQDPATKAAETESEPDQSDPHEKSYLANQLIRAALEGRQSRVIAWAEALNGKSFWVTPPAKPKPKPKPRTRRKA